MNRSMVSRRRLLGCAFASAALSACGGGGGDAGGPAPGVPNPPPPPGSSAGGRVIAESTQGLMVFDVRARTRRVYAVLDSNLQTGVTASDAGLIADQNGYFGPNSAWRATLRSAVDGSIVTSYDVVRSGSLPVGAVAITRDGQRLALAISEPVGGNYRDRIVVFERASSAITDIDPGDDAVWLGSGELLIRTGDRVRVLSAALGNLGELPITVTARDAAASGSPDGRTIVYESNGQIRAYDRSNGSSWLAASSTRTLYAPVVSPDGAFLAVLRGATSSGLFVHVVPFAAGRTFDVADAASLSTTAGEALPGDERFAWIP